jgi:hypothetical protein
VTYENTGQPFPAPPPQYLAPPPKKGMSTGAIIAIVIGSLIALCCVGGVVVVLASGDDTPASTAATDAATDAAGKPTAAAPTKADEPDGPVTVKVGEAINVRSRSTETKVTIVTVAKAKSDNSFDKPVRGQYVAVNVDIFATKGATDLGPSNFRLVASDGTVYKYEIMVAGIEPQLDAMTKVEQGQRKTGLVVFDIDPAKFAGLKVQVSDDSGDVQGYWAS